MDANERRSRAGLKKFAYAKGSCWDGADASNGATSSVARYTEPPPHERESRQDY